MSAHTALRDLIYSELITAKVDDYALPAPEPPPALKGGRGGRKGRAAAESDEEDEEDEEEAAPIEKLPKKNKKKNGGAPRVAPTWD